MSGINGIYMLDGRAADADVLKRMTDSLAHRGPDGSAIWLDGPIGLGHSMLWTTPESLGEKLPLASNDESCVLTADARIDNRRELITALGLSQAPSQITDAEIILASYMQWGERCPEKLLGDFSFAVYDKGAQHLFCARDHMGVKPFCYYRAGEIFAFASEIKGLFCVPEVPRKLNEVRVADYLTLMMEDREITFYQGILRLPAAHTLTASKKKVTLRRYWSLDPTRELHYDSDESYVKAFRGLFTEAVRCRLRSAFPLGSHLSGGLDSSSVVCTARELSSSEGCPRLHTFSAIFDNVPESDERSCIDLIVNQGGIEPHYVYPDRFGPLSAFDDVVKLQDEPNLFFNRSMFAALFEAAKKSGTRVLLDGDDGDDILDRREGLVAELIRTGKWRTLISEVKGQSERFNQSPFRILFGQAIKPFFYRSALGVFRRLRRQRELKLADCALLNPELARQIRFADRVQSFGGDEPGIAASSRERHYRLLAMGFNQYALEEWDQMAAAFSIEIRDPYDDRRLVEFCLALPPEQLYHHGWTKMILRRSMDNLLPKAIQWRSSKASFDSLIIRGLITFDRPLLDEIICHNQQVIERYIDMRALRGVYNRYKNQFVKNPASISWRDVRGVWIAANLTRWLHQWDGLNKADK
jgi:asparagine synthase (glutamine-hydrolysing)